MQLGLRQVMYTEHRRSLDDARRSIDELTARIAELTAAAEDRYQHRPRTDDHPHGSASHGGGGDDDYEGIDDSYRWDEP